jgi:photosystem II stability/assembly factor-like uncharacterized protein
MYRFFLSVILCMGSLFLTAQWEWVNPLPQGNEIKDMCMTPSGHIIAVGTSKTIILSEDHGATWQVINLGNNPQTHFYGVFFVDDNLGWITGDKYLLKTTDGGKSWDTAYYAIDQRLISVFFINSQKGWAVGDGGKIIRTTDGGDSWQLMTSGSNKNLTSVCFADENIGVAVGEKGTILYTEKGGLEWEKIAIDLNADLFRVFCKDFRCLNIVGQDGLVLFSGDGRNWRTRSVPVHRHIYDGYFKDVDTGWVCGYSKDVYYTTDGGLSWTPQWAGGSGKYPDYFTLCTNGQNELWIAGRYSNLIKTTDGGAEWTHINPGLRNYLDRISFVSTTEGWVIDDEDTIYKTTDGGYHWEPSAYADSYLTNLFCLDEDHIYVCGNGFILSTVNGGQTWSTYNFAAEYVYLEDIFFSDPQHGWTINDSDTIYITNDGGIHWNAVALPFYAYNNRALFFVDQDNGWLAGDCIYHTTDGGITWDLQIQGGLNPNDIYFSDLMTGWYIENDGYIFHTTDGGENWTVQLTNAYYIFEMAFIDDQHAWVVGYDGILWSTTNGGVNWTKSYLPTLNTFCSISAVDQDHIWVCGNNGAILRYAGDGVPSHDFNDDILPITDMTINQQENEFLSLPGNEENATSSSILRVYNLQGAMVCQVNNQDNIGLNYRSYLSGLNLETGIYIIRLIKGDRVETRKIVVY